MVFTPKTNAFCITQKRYNMAGGIVGSIAGSVAGKALGGLLGGKGGGSTASAGGVAPLLFKAGGLRSTFDGDGNLRIVQYGDRQNLINSIRDSFLDQSSSIRDNLLPRFEGVFSDGISRLDNLIGQVRPGFGALTDARVLANDRARERGLSNLQGALNKRRVSGSSFAQNSLISAENEFAEQEARLRAQSFLEELELTSALEADRLKINTASAETVFDLLMQAFTLDRNATNVELQEQNKLADIALGLIEGVQRQQNRNANLAIDDTVAANRMSGLLSGQFGSSIGGYAGNAFNAGLAGLFGSGFSAGSLPGEFIGWY